MVRLREAVEADWPAILEAADAAVPWATELNREWLENRHRFSPSDHPRRHYVAEDPAAGRVVGYGAIEGGAEPGVFRIFVVMDPELLNGGVGEVVYQKLMTELIDVNATAVWAREETLDVAL